MFMTKQMKNNPTEEQELLVEFSMRDDDKILITLEADFFFLNTTKRNKICDAIRKHLEQ